jgi:hypothetical protein
MPDLLDAAARGDLATIKRLLDEGARVSKRDVLGITALMAAALNGHSTTVKCLQAAGASITEKSNIGWSALHYAAHNGILSLVQYFLQEAGASISDATDDGRTVWPFLMPKLEDADLVVLISLLKVIVMLDDAPPAFVAKLSPAHAELTTRGRYFRAQLPAYLEQQRASVVEHCPLPTVLLPIVAEYAATTPEDMWEDGLRVHVPRPKRARAMAGADDEAEVQLRRSPRLHQKRSCRRHVDEGPNLFY